ncbi:MAG: hypothetical protein DLM72_02660 [Candidatus Nitrosopolaris wilkensis]|nr:MAG: hypothetical protein DLM72_02660 [Candidatus Nitrosopolaris wilkensis]
MVRVTRSGGNTVISDMDVDSLMIDVDHILTRKIVHILGDIVAA